MKDSLKLSIALGITCALAASILTFANSKTREPRAEAARRNRQQALSLVLPAFDNAPLDDKIQIATETGDVFFYLAKEGGKLTGLAGEGASPKGYGGQLQVLIGLNPSGDIGTVLVTGHKETPGLGTQVTDRKQTRSIWSLFGKDAEHAQASSLPPCPYLDQYAGKAATATGFRVQQDGGGIEAISGATVSSRAVADAVSTVSKAFASHRNEILAAEK